MALTPRGPQIDVTIDELVLDGVAPGDPAVAQAVDHAVAQALAAQRGVSPSGAEILAVSAAPRAPRVGGAVADAVTQEAPR